MMHSHSAADECPSSCPAHNPNGWRCSRCYRQRPMMADSENWKHPLCDECFAGLQHSPDILVYRFGAHSIHGTTE